MAFGIQNKNGNLATMWDCYQGAGQWADGTILRKHERESDQGYTRRVSAFNSPAIYRYLIDTFDVLYANNPARVNSGDLYERFTWNAGMGLTLSALLARALKMGEVQGASFLVMDTREDQATNLADMLNANTLPYLTIIPAADVSGLAVDEHGQLTYFAYSYYAYDASGELQIYYKAYTEGQAIVSDKDGLVMSRVDIPQGSMPVIPVVPSGEPLRSGFLPASPTIGLYQGQVGIANTNSLIDESIYSQQFSVLFVASKDKIDTLKLGTSNVLKVSEGSAASFISPSGTPVDLMLKRVDTNVLYMQKSFANLLTSGETQSGVAKEIDRQVGTMQLKNLAVYMESIEYAVYELFAMFVGTGLMADYTVQYYKDFDLGAIADYIANANIMLQSTWSPETTAAIREDLIHKYFIGADPDLVARLTIAEAAKAVTVKAPVVPPVKEENDNQQPA